MSHYTKKRAALELLFAAVLWGLSFIAAKWAVDGFPAAWVSVLRFGLASLLVLPFLFKAPRGTARLALLPGLLLGMALLFQNLGLCYTTVTKNSFITTLYVVFVPIIDFLHYRKKFPPLLGLYVGLAVMGAGLVCRVEVGDWNLGDLLTLGCALVSAYHIIAIERVSDRIGSPFFFNVYQGIWACLMALPIALAGSPLSFPRTFLPWAGVIFLATVVGLVAFTIQVRAQRVLSSTNASMFYLLESPFATLSAYFLLGETVTAGQLSGGLLILIAAFGTLRLQSIPGPKPILIS